MPRERNILEWDGFFKKHIWGGFTWNSKFSHRQPLPLHTNQYKLIQIALYSLYRVPSYLISSKKTLETYGETNKTTIHSFSSAKSRFCDSTSATEGSTELGSTGRDASEGGASTSWGVVSGSAMGSKALLIWSRGIWLSFGWDLFRKNCSCLFIRSGSNTDVHDVYYKNLEIVWTLQNIIYSCPAVTFSHW